MSEHITCLGIGRERLRVLPLVTNVEGMDEK